MPESWPGWTWPKYRSMLRFRPFAVTFNEGGRGVTLYMTRNAFRLYVAGWVLVRWPRFMQEKEQIRALRGAEKRAVELAA